MQATWRILSTALTYDFCPWANRWVYWMKRPLANLCFVAAAACGCALLGKPATWLALAAVLALGILWPTVAVRGLAATVTFRQRRVSEGDTALVLVQIVNRWPWPVWGIALESGFGPGAGVALARVSGWSATEFEWEFVPDCRGEYPLQTPQISTGFPFGLRQAWRAATVAQTLLVWPHIIPLDTLLDAAETRPAEELFSDRRTGDSGDVAGTRLFRAGDSLRRVHWVQTARTGRMIVCERQAAVQSTVRVVFDSDPRLHRGEGKHRTLEWAVRIAASVCAAYHRENAQVECCFGHETLPVAGGTLGWQRFADALARWKPCESGHGTDCLHEHSVRECRRIHHRHCGAYQLTVTTDLGLLHRTEHRHVHGDERKIVLYTPAFAGVGRESGDDGSPPDRFSVILDRPDNVAGDFLEKWRHICHEG
jgi:uncharacterized protein (DUF58 family)